MTTLESSTEESIEEQLTLFVEATRANPSVKPGSAKAQRMTATSGRRCLELLNNADPLGSLLKTLLVTSEWGSTKCSLIWKAKATPQGRLLFQLVPSMHTINEIESGLLPTPTATSYGSNQGGAAGRKGKVRYSLQSMAIHNMWPTPSVANANQGTSVPDGKRGMSLISAVKAPHLWQTPNKAEDGKSGQLNPEWVEWLMGYPEGWTELKP